MAKQIRSFLFLSAIAVCFSSCGVNCFYPTLHFVRTSDDVRGHVYDLTTGQPVQNARISFEGKKHRSASTDRNGYYHIGSGQELGFFMCNFDGQSSAPFYGNLKAEHETYRPQPFSIYGTGSLLSIPSHSTIGGVVLLELPKDYPKVELPAPLTRADCQKIRLQIAEWERQKNRMNKSPQNFQPESKRYLADIYLKPKTCAGETP